MIARGVCARDGRVRCVITRTEVVSRACSVCSFLCVVCLGSAFGFSVLCFFGMLLFIYLCRLFALCCVSTVAAAAARVAALHTCAATFALILLRFTRIIMVHICGWGYYVVHCLYAHIYAVLRA